MVTVTPKEELTSIGIVPLHGTIILKARIPEGSAIILPETADKNADMYDNIEIAALSEAAYKDGLRIGDKVALQPLFSDVYVVYLPPGTDQMATRKAGDFDYLIFERMAILGALV